METVLGYPLTNFIKVDTTGNFLNDIAQFVEKKEGWGDDDKKDSASSVNIPTPVNGFRYGKPHVFKGLHTRRGVTLSAFRANASKLGYDGSDANFIAMPNDIWLKIYREVYLKPFANATTSELINFYLSMWSWGSGVGGAKNLIRSLGTPIQDYLNKYGEKATLEMLVKARIKFFENLAKQPKNAGYLNGWINGALSFYKNFANYASGNSVVDGAINEVKKKPLTTIVITTLVIVSLYVLITTLNKKSSKS